MRVIDVICTYVKVVCSWWAMQCKILDFHGGEDIIRSFVGCCAVYCSPNRWYSFTALHGAQKPRKPWIVLLLMFLLNFVQLLWLLWTAHIAQMGEREIHARFWRRNLKIRHFEGRRNSTKLYVRYRNVMRLLGGLNWLRIVSISISLYEF